MAGTLAAEIQMNVSASKLWETINAPDNVVPKLMPDYIASSEYIEGDGGVGSVKLMKYGPAVANFVTFAKEKLEILDDANKTLTYSVIEGELLNFFKLYRVSVSVVEGEVENSCRVTWSVEYEPVSPEIPPPEMAKEGAVSTFKALELYLLGNFPNLASQDGI